MALIEITDLPKVYGSHEVLKGIDLSVDRHQVVSLIGASGSGKSTLLRCLNALEPINGGQISIDGDVVSGPGVGQSRDAARDQARALLDRVQLGHRAEYYPDQLSGGQQQRVAIVLASS